MLLNFSPPCPRGSSVYIKPGHLLVSIDVLSTGLNSITISPLYRQSYRSHSVNHGPIQHLRSPDRGTGRRGQRPQRADQRPEPVQQHQGEGSMQQHPRDRASIARTTVLTAVRDMMVHMAAPCLSNLASLAFSYCGDHLASDGVIYLQGTGGKFVNMDIDCDGTQHGVGDDGRCGYQRRHPVHHVLPGHREGLQQGVNDLNAFVHSYVVFGNVGSKEETGRTSTLRRTASEPLSIMAVVCGNGKMVRAGNETEEPPALRPGRFDAIARPLTSSLGLRCLGR